MEPTFAPLTPEAPKNNSKTIIIAVVALLLILCCCCVVIGLWGWNYGDQIIESLGL
ncbi:MAG: hypothetical protein Fur0016_16660 [Anaerolineales bacterium]